MTPSSLRIRSWTPQKQPPARIAFSVSAISLLLLVRFLSRAIDNNTVVDDASAPETTPPRPASAGPRGPPGPRRPRGRRRSGRGLGYVQGDRGQRIGRDDQPELAPRDPPSRRVGLDPHPLGPQAGVSGRPRRDLVTVDAEGQLPRAAGAVGPVLGAELELGDGHVLDAEEARAHTGPIQVSAAEREGFCPRRPNVDSGRATAIR